MRKVLDANMIELPPEIEQQLADLSDAEFSALTARLRAPDIGEQFREVAKSIVPPHALATYLEIANPAAFVGADGLFDEAAARESLGVLFGSSTGSGYRQWGQHGSTPSTTQPGDGGRAAAQRYAERHGQPGTAAGAEALRRMSSVVENAGSAEARRRAARRGFAGGRDGGTSGAGSAGRAEAQRRRDTKAEV
jgi:hypothetical protein